MNKRSMQAKLKKARVGHLATADSKGRPHVIPVCFVYSGRAFYTPLDLKPKRVAPERLARVRHIQARPNVAFLIDEYQEDWNRLWYILVRGVASLLDDSDTKEYKEAHHLLREKYPQYAGGLLPQRAPLIRILPARIISWGNPQRSDPAERARTRSFLRLLRRSWN